MEEVRNEEKAVIVVRNEESPIEEDNGEHAGKENEENNGEFSMEEDEEEEEDEENEDYGMEEEKNEEDPMEEKEEKNEVVRNEENPIEEEDNGEHAGKENEEKNGEFSIEEEEDGEEEDEDEENEDYGMEEEKNEEDAMEEKEEKNEEDAMEDKEAENDKSKEHNKEKVGANLNEKVRKPRKRNRRKKVTQGVADKVVSKDEDKPESKGKKSKKVESMGMIFMCSSKTKKDCYRYKVLGLPASKKDIVQKIYKGMRLFLFDFDLRLMYGIYKAAGPGGSNIEPKAFKSAFPSQVRFTVLEDCLPLAEENFKKVIKDNYYSKNKFDCQLNSEQVKKLCKLFVSASKGSKPPKVGTSLVAERHISGDQGRIRRRGRVEERGSALGRERSERRHLERRVIYTTEVFPSQVAPLPRTPGPLYAYERTLEMDPYRREPVIERRGLQLVELEPRHHYETGRLDPYPSYGEREAPSYHEPVYSARLQREYYPPAALPAEYHPVGRAAEYRTTANLPTEYRSSAGLPAEYHSSASLLAEYRAAGIPTENLAPAGLPHEYRLVGPPTEYRSSSGALRDYHSLRTVHRY